MRYTIRILLAGGTLAAMAMGVPSGTALAQSWKDAGSKFSGRAFEGEPAYRGGEREYRSFSYAPAQPQVAPIMPQTQRSFSYAPAPMLQVGDEVVVTAQRANLMVGYQTVGTATAGQRLKVLKVEGPWVGTQIDVAGQPVGGWIRSELVTMAPTIQR